MRKELANSGLSEEEILAKTMLLQKALAGDNSPAFVNKTIKSALQAANISTEDLAKVLKKGCTKKKNSWNFLYESNSDLSPCLPRF